MPVPVLAAVAVGGAAMFGVSLWPSDTPRPEGLRGDQIYKWFQEGKGPGAGISPIQQTWNNVGKQYDEVKALVEKVLRDSHGVWEGKAADSARDQISPMAAFADHAKQMASNTAKAVGQQGTDWHGCKNQLKPVAENPPQNNLGNKLNPFTTNLDREIEKFKTDTSDNQRVYAGYGVRTNDNGNSLPTWLTPPQISGDVSVVKPEPGGPGGPGQPGGPGGGGRLPGGGAGGNFGQFGGGSGGGAGGGAGGGTGGGGTGVGGGTGGGSADIPVVNVPPRDQTTSAGWADVPVAGGNQGPTGVPGGGPSGGGGGTGGGFPGGFAGGFGPGGSAGGPGAGGSAGVGKAGGPGFGPAGAGVAGRPGAPGMGGMPMGGAGAGRKEEDQEHERASFLMETEDIFGDNRSVAPPVIGE